MDQLSALLRESPNA